MEYLKMNHLIENTSGNSMADLLTAAISTVGLSDITSNLNKITIDFEHNSISAIGKRENNTSVLKITGHPNGVELQATSYNTPLSIEDRRKQAKKLHDAGRTEQEIATSLGVSQPTISRDLKK